jgi:putative transposase
MDEDRKMTQLLIIEYGSTPLDELNKADPAGNKIKTPFMDVQICATKRRKKVFTEKLAIRTKEIFEKTLSKYNQTLTFFDWGADYIAISYEGAPLIHDWPGNILGRCKSATTKMLKKDFPEITPNLWKNKLWNEDTGYLTSGPGYEKEKREYLEGCVALAEKNKREFFENYYG